MVCRNKKMSIRTKNIQGQKFGRLLALSKAPSQYRRTCWNVICDCGATKIVTGAAMLNGNTKSCGCLQKEKASEANKLFDSNPALRKLIDSYRNSAKRRGYNFPLTVEEADKLFQQNCFYCGRKPHRIFTENKGKYTYNYNGIDRIDNSKDYLVDNIQTCCKDCNYAKNEMKHADFVDWVKRVYINLGLK